MIKILGPTLLTISFISWMLMNSLEAIGIKKRGGQVKILGTIVCIGGAMLLSFYHGHLIDIQQPKIKWHYTHDNTTNRANNGSSSHYNFLLGPLLVLASNLAMAIWFIIQVSSYHII